MNACLFGMEAELAEWVKEHKSRLPIVAFMAGRFMDEMKGMRFGHAGTIVEGKEDTTAEKIKRMEAAGINVAERYGGLVLGNVEAVLVIEELAKISGAVAFPVFESCVGPVRAIEHFAQESLKQRVIPAVCRGEKMVAVSMSEPNAGSALTDQLIGDDGADTIDGRERAACTEWKRDGGAAGVQRGVVVGAKAQIVAAGQRGQAGVLPGLGLAVGQGGAEPGGAGAGAEGLEPGELRRSGGQCRGGGLIECAHQATSPAIQP